MKFRITAASALFALGLASMAGAVPPFADYTYPLVWWGLLPIVDGWNRARAKSSLATPDFAHFLMITMPVSVLFWLFFEALNLPSPQWHYRGGINALWAQSLFGFVAFATVLPIMAESWWLIAGPYCFPLKLSVWFRRSKWLSVSIGVILISMPFLNHFFWFNQGMWVAPAFLLLPFTKIEPCTRPRRFLLHLVLNGLIAGFFWELFNYGSRTHWEYLILPGAPHLFQMPLPGYLGFIPFALAALVVYEFQRKIPARAGLSAALYAIALIVLFALTTVYQHRGLWVVP